MGFSIDEFPYTSEYDSDLRSVLKYVRHWIDELDKISKQYDELVKECSDLPEIRSKLKDIYHRISVLGDMHYHLRQLDDEVFALQAHIDAVREHSRLYTDKRFGRAMLRIRELCFKLYKLHNIRDEFRAADYELKMECYYHIFKESQSLQSEINSINKTIEDIVTSVENPWRTEQGKKSIKQNFKYAYNDLADECLTAEQYCKLNITADKYAWHDITARDYVEFGKTKLHWYWVYSPVSGYRQDVNVVMTSIVGNFAGTMTADKYKEHDWTAQQYADTDMTAWEYYRADSSEFYGLYVTEDGALHLERGGEDG